MARVFVADDNPHVHRMVEDALGSEGHHVSGVREGIDLLECLISAAPDLVLLDATLPGVRTYDLCREILAQQELDRARVVLLAGPLESIDDSEATQAGVFKVLQKPISAPDLSAVAEGLTSPQDEAGEPRQILLETLVGEALENPDATPTREAIREQVADAVSAAMPAVIDRIADRLADRWKNPR